MRDFPFWRTAAASEAERKSLGSQMNSYSDYGSGFVVGEACKQLDWLDEPVTRGHWRAHDGDGVDLVVEREDGMVSAIEVKAGSRVQRGEVKGLLKLSRRLGNRFLGGVVLYTGARYYTNEDKIHIVPVQRLWRS